MTETTAITIPEQFQNTSKVHLLMPATDMELAPYHRVSFRTVQISTNINDGDIYKERNGDFAPTKRGLNRLASAAGGIWTPTQIDRDGEGRVTAHAMLRLRAPDGQEQVWPGTYTWDTPARIEEAESRMQRDLEKPTPKKFNDKREAFERWIRDKFEKERHQLIIHATSRAEAGAMNRAIRSALGLKSTYDLAEFKKPFVVMCVSVDVFSMPIAQRMIASAMLGQQLAGLGFAEMPQFNNPALSMIQQPQSAFVDPMSDAVDSGEVEAMLAPEVAEFVEEPVIMEEMEVDESEIEDLANGSDRDEPLEEIDEYEPATLEDFRKRIYQIYPDKPVAWKDQYIANWLEREGGDPDQALLSFDKALADHRKKKEAGNANKFVS